MPQALLKLRQSAIGPILPSLMEILYNWSAGPHIPGQWDPAAIDLQKNYKTSATNNSRAYDSKKNVTALPDLLIGQHILYITIKDDYLPDKFTQSPEVTWSPPLPAQTPGAIEGISKPWTIHVAPPTEKRHSTLFSAITHPHDTMPKKS